MPNKIELIAAVEPVARAQWPELAPKQRLEIAAAWATEHVANFGEQTTPSESEIRLGLGSLEQRPTAKHMFRPVPTPAEVYQHLLADQQLSPADRATLSRKIADMDPDERLRVCPIDAPIFAAQEKAKAAADAKASAPPEPTTAEQLAKQAYGDDRWRGMPAGKQAEVLAYLAQNVMGQPVRTTSEQMMAEADARGKAFAQLSPVERMTIARAKERETAAAANAAKLKA